MIGLIVSILVTENRLKSQITAVESSSHLDLALFRAVERGDAGTMSTFHDVLCFLNGYNCLRSTNRTT